MPPDYIIEVLVDSDPTSTSTTSSDEDVIVEVGSTTSSSLVSDPVMIEVYAVPAGERLVESLQFFRQGNLAVMTGNSQYPFSGGTFTIASLGARVSTAPTGASVILDIKKNGTSIFDVPANRPTIADGFSSATIGATNSPTFTTGDYLSIDILQIGSTNPGSDLVVSIRLYRIA